MKRTVINTEVRQIKSMVDGTYNLTLNIPEYHLDIVRDLIDVINGMLTIQILGAIDKDGTELIEYKPVEDK